MKNKFLYFLLTAILSFNYSYAGCTFNIQLSDSNFDGWSGGKVDLVVNNVLKLDDITMAKLGSNREDHYFSVNTGDIISTEYTAGKHSEENSYSIYNSEGLIIADTGGGSSGETPTNLSNILVFCPIEPEEELIVPEPTVPVTPEPTVPVAPTPTKPVVKAPQVPVAPTPTKPVAQAPQMPAPAPVYTVDTTYVSAEGIVGATAVVDADGNNIVTASHTVDGVTYTATVVTNVAGETLAVITYVDPATGEVVTVSSGNYPAGTTIHVMILNGQLVIRVNLQTNSQYIS